MFPGNGKQRWSEGRMAELERKVGQQTLEIDFLKGCLQRIEEQRHAAGTEWQAAVYRQVEKEMKTGAESDGAADVRVWAGLAARDSTVARTPMPTPSQEDWNCATPCSGSRWNCPATAGRA